MFVLYYFFDNTPEMVSKTLELNSKSTPIDDIVQELQLMKTTNMGYRAAIMFLVSLGAVYLTYQLTYECDLEEDLGIRADF